MAKVQDYINNRHKYKVDQTYQRPPDAWSREDNQCLIDTILRNEPMPLFLFNHKSSDGIFYTVDGQQRLGAILKFFDNEWGLNRKFSGEENHGKKFGGDNPISDEQRENFLNYYLNFKIIENYDDERIRMIFSRLQRGKPLTLGERLNAKPGDIVVRMREIANHPFIKKSIGIAKNRYGHYPDAARIIFYEKYGCKDSGTSAIMSFFDENRSIYVTDKDYKNAVYVLNFLARCFPPEPGDYQFFSKHAWVFSVYTMIRELMLGYALNGQEQNIRKFIENFHGKIYSESFRSSNPDYQKFYDNVRGGWSERIIALRRNILIRKFLETCSVDEKDKRQINDEKKIACFTKHAECQTCGKKFKDYKEPEYHHKTMYAFGGKSEIDNIMVLCTECHDEIHGAEKIQPPTENEIAKEESEKENKEVQLTINAVQHSTREVKRGQVTTQVQYFIPILESLIEEGGEDLVEKIYDKVEQKMKDILMPKDYESLNSGEIRWRNSSRFARNLMVDRDFLVKNSPRGTWKITDKGREYYNQNKEK